MDYETVPCILCRTHDYRPLFSKPGAGHEFTLVQCSTCGLEFVNPRPHYDVMPQFYEGYFDRRTDRGYNNYCSKPMHNEVMRLLTLNLNDLRFYEHESQLAKEKYSLDVGCAAGYFVDYLSKRGWTAQGIDIAQDCIDYARNTLHVNAHCGDFLSFDFGTTFHCITLWATIEHLHYPDAFVKKIHSLLKDNGMLYLSTCRSSIFSARVIYKQRWRYYNFPHHLYFFSYTTLAKLLQINGFAVTRFSTYGSGVGKSGSALRAAADAVAKQFFLGDMMLIAARKRIP